MAQELPHARVVTKKKMVTTTKQFCFLKSGRQRGDYIAESSQALETLFPKKKENKRAFESFYQWFSERLCFGSLIYWILKPE